MTQAQAQALPRSSPSDAATPRAPLAVAPARPRPTSIAERAARAFPKHAFVAGYALYAGGHVAVAGSTNGGVDAIVRTSRARPVRVRAADGAVAIGCGCTATSLEGDGVGCKHAWAVLLEIDRLALLEPLRASASPLRVTRLDVGDGAAVPAASAPPAPKTTAARAAPAASSAKTPKAKPAAPAPAAAKAPPKTAPAKTAAKETKTAAPARTAKSPTKQPAKAAAPTKRSRSR
jgi:hypothetical protein